MYAPRDIRSIEATIDLCREYRTLISQAPSEQLRQVPKIRTPCKSDLCIALQYRIRNKTSTFSAPHSRL
jgi:hypothetical protein